jgi:fibronectin type 3 domain-containing protein
MKRLLLAMTFILLMATSAFGQATATATAHSVVLTWTQSPNPTCTPVCPVTGNKVYRGTTAGGESATAYMVFTTPTTTFTDTAVTNGTTYYYKVTAVNINGESGKSNEASAVIPNPLPPNAPTGLIATPQ